MRGLRFRVSASNQGSRFPEPESQLPKQPLALAGFQIDTEVLCNVAGEGFAIPNSTALDAHLSRRFPQGGLYSGQLVAIQPGWTPWALSFQKPRKTGFLKPVHPVFHRPRSIAQHAGCFPTTNAMSDQQHTVEPVIISRLIRTTDFILQRQNHCFGVRNVQFLHGPNKAQGTKMRNYL
jgi:hypothetical protein